MTGAVPGTAAYFARGRLVQQFNDAVSLYNTTRDGRHLWRAFLVLHDAGEPLPPDLLAHFAEWARGVLAADGSREIAAALELAGDDKNYKGRKASQAAKRDQSLARLVHELRTVHGVSLTRAFAVVARDRGLNVPTVKKAYYGVMRKTP
ncbi:hypothetical protein JI739_07780 [Ramlibacter sp. AW1]|uniref:Uncharacterized protein n=1 Tax=Ramlibacter aurantiacus TaxID=2801330 RepID=A0A936ZSD5_9BURK|nr:hypothetical protein [Ramlibacter aurantiacus]MBL0420240.1 hypothetical protein [Ramlibacter aurantiacus]